MRLPRRMRVAGKSGNSLAASLWRRDQHDGARHAGTGTSRQRARVKAPRKPSKQPSSSLPRPLQFAYHVYALQVLPSARPARPPDCLSPAALTLRPPLSPSSQLDVRHLLPYTPSGQHYPATTPGELARTPSAARLAQEYHATRGRKRPTIARHVVDA